MKRHRFLNLLNGGTNLWVDADDPQRVVGTSEHKPSDNVMKIAGLLRSLNTANNGPELLKELNDRLKLYRSFLEFSFQNGKYVPQLFTEWRDGMGLHDDHTISHFVEFASDGYLQKLGKCSKPDCEKFVFLRDGGKQTFCSKEHERETNQSTPRNRAIAAAYAKAMHWEDDRLKRRRDRNEDSDYRKVIAAAWAEYEALKANDHTESLKQRNVFRKLRKLLRQQQMKRQQEKRFQ